MTVPDAPAGRYSEAGVDITAGNTLVEHLRPLARATRRPGAAADLGGFGGLFDLAAAGYRDPLLVATTDGVGTKILLALETGLERGIGIDLVAMCVNDLVVQGAEPLLFLDYYATGRLDPERALAVLEGVAEGCRIAGCALVGGETAELPGLYAPGHYDLAGFALGAVERGRVLPRADVGPGDLLLGLGSSGAHSNGFSLIRLILRETGADLAAAAPWDAAGSLAAALLAPTRIYVAACRAAIAAGGVKAMAHITGGGLVENLPRALPADTTARIDVSSWPLPPLFAWLRDRGRLGTADLARTFNSGIGMVLVVEPAAVSGVEQALVAAGETVHRIGDITAGRGAARVELIGAEDAWRAASAS